MLLRALVFVVGCLTVAGCQQAVPAAAAAEPKPGSVWMARSFSWGAQCAGDAGGASSQAPDAGGLPLGRQVDACFHDQVTSDEGVSCALKAISAAGVTVIQNQAEPLVVCQGCGCPKQGVRLMVSVVESSRDTLAQAGFTLRKRPPSSGP